MRDPEEPAIFLAERRKLTRFCFVVKCRVAARRWRVTPSYFGCISAKRIVGTTAAAVWSPYVSASTSTKRVRRRGDQKSEFTTTTTWSVARATTARRRWRSTNKLCHQASKEKSMISNHRRRNHRENFVRISPWRVPRESFMMCTLLRDLEARVSSWVKRFTGRRLKLWRLSMEETLWRRMDIRR